MSSDILDPIAVACAELCEVISDAQSKEQKDNLIIEHIKKCSKVGGKIGDFKNGLEWFNVTKPLSLSSDLKGKVVVLDFFTYCCINCMHIFPHLKLLEDEFSIKNGLVVIGVHSAKFDNEKDSNNILAAVQRYSVSHPVVNDADGDMWSSLGIPCWPTLLILGPNGEPFFLAMGESHMDIIFVMVRTAMAFFRQQGQLLDHNLPVAPSVHLLPKTSLLLFPGKVASCWAESAVDPNCNIGTTDHERLAVSDTGHHRILVLSGTGEVEYVIGGTESGFADGSFLDARFNSPQGVAFATSQLLYVADTVNHAIREVNLQTRQVSTLSGNGSRGTDLLGGQIGTQQALSSPWDLAITTCPTSGNYVVLIAMAGSHQIWALFPQGGTWWKGKSYLPSVCAVIAGNGKEENRNNSYPHAASFSQPSGLSVAHNLQAVFIADSESSSIRRLSLADGKVSAVIGGDRSPFNLFAFGDVDGQQWEAKLQHPLDVAWCAPQQKLYVADSYNHKLKVVEVGSNRCHSVLGSGQPGDSSIPGSVQLNEPGGLCLSVDGRRLFVADTNNHCIKVVDLATYSVSKLKIDIPTEHKDMLQGMVNKSEAAINPAGGKITLILACSLDKHMSLTAGAPQKWTLTLPGEQWAASPCSGDFQPHMNVQMSVPAGSPGTTASVLLRHRLFVCEGEKQCSVKNQTLVLTVRYDAGASANVVHNLTHVFS